MFVIRVDVSVDFLHPLETLIDTVASMFLPVLYR